MANINKPNTFSANTTALPIEVNDNFDTIYNEFNGNISASNLATDAVTTAKISDANVTAVKLATSSVTPEKILTGTGTGWAWQSWTPTFTNLSGGTLNYAKYIQIGKTIHFRLKYTLGGAGVAGEVSFTPPASFNADYSSNVLENLGAAGFGDTGTAAYTGVTVWLTGGNIAVRRYAVTTQGQISAISSTTPFTWANTDIITAQGTYEAA